MLEAKIQHFITRILGFQPKTDISWSCYTKNISSLVAEADNFKSLAQKHVFYRLFADDILSGKQTIKCMCLSQKFIVVILW